MNETTLEATRRLWQEGERVLALNFASAKNPGGGFLSGSQAQEESLARASGIYICLTGWEQMYVANRQCGTCLYTDHMIYSPDVPVFRDSEDRLLESPYRISFVTAPAVNAGAVRRNEPENVGLIESAMKSRIEMVLSVAMLARYDTLVLGAWGCGVFGNAPDNVARWFAGHLIDGVFSSVFKRVVFAVLDHSADRSTIHPFFSAFSRPAPNAKADRRKLTYDR